MADRDKFFRVAVRRFGPFESAIAKQWDAFEARHHTGLKLEAVPFDLHPLYESLFVNRGLIQGDFDVAFVNTDWLAEAGETGGLLDLSSYIDASPPQGFPGAWSESLLRLQTFGTHILGLPYHDGPECLIYRKDLFESTAQEIPQTWEQFRHIAQVFTQPENGLYGTAFAAFPDGHNTVYDFCLQLWTRGGELFDSSGRMLLDTPQAIEALDFYRQLLNDAGAVHPASRTFDSVKAGYAFAAGKIAMMVNWFGFASMSETIPESKVKGRVGVAPIPSGTGAGVSLNVYWILGISSGSPHRDVAWKFIRDCASPEMDKLITLEGGIGCRKSTWSDVQVNASIPFYKVLADLHVGARELPRLRNWAQLAEVIDRMVLDAIDGQESTATIIRKAQAQADHLHENRREAPRA
jgi:multiple sugar transport system substrate-binding protein